MNCKNFANESVAVCMLEPKDKPLLVYASCIALNIIDKLLLVCFPLGGRRVGGTPFLMGGTNDRLALDWYTTPSLS